MDRRALLGRVAALATAGLAGCTGGGDSTPTETPTATARPEPTPTSTPSPAAGAADQTVDVGPGGDLRFDPPSFQITAGDTVQWVFRSGGHNVKADTVPEGADWTGTPGGEFETIETGATYEHTFTVAGDYDYFCGPHRSAGMVASFTVDG